MIVDIVWTKDVNKCQNASALRPLLAHPHEGVCLASVGTWTISQSQGRTIHQRTTKTETMNTETLALRRGIDKGTGRNFAQ